MKKFVKLIASILLMTMLITSLTGCTPQLSSSCVPSGAGSVSPANGTYENGVLVDVTATPNSGYRFDHWEGGASGKSPTLHLTMNNSKKLVAYFTKTYTLSVSCSPTVGGSVSPNIGVYDEKSQVTLVASPNQYYQFNGWAGDISGSLDHLTLTMDSDKKINAIFVKSNITIQTQILPQGAGTINPSSGSFVAGIQKTITATPAPGYRFDHWGGSANGTANPVSVLMDTNKTLTAYFTKTYTLTMGVSPVGGGSVSPGNGIYDAGTSITLTADSSVFPYAFDHWSGTDNDSVNPTTINMNADESVIANYKKLTAGGLVTDTNTIQGGCLASITIELNQFQWIQGDIWGPFLSAYIQDANGTIVKDLGKIQDTSFTFNAEVTGPYILVLYNWNVFSAAGYKLSYTIYHR